MCSHNDTLDVCVVGPSITQQGTVNKKGMVSLPAEYHLSHFNSTTVIFLQSSVKR